MKKPIRVAQLLAAYELLRAARRMLVKADAPRAVVATLDDALQELSWEIPSDESERDGTRS